MRGKLSGLVIVTCLLAFVIIALMLRIIPAYSQVFSDGWVKFTTPDTYYFMRQVDHIVYNFPKLMPVDPYFSLAGGGGSGELNFFVLMLGAVTLLFSAGSPGPEAIDLVGMYFPVVLGALTVVAGYFLGRTLFNRWAGLLTAGLLAIMPGEFLARTGLGAVDRDCLQVLLVVVTMLFTVMAVKYSADNDLFAGNWRNSGRRAIIQPFIYSLLAGVLLGIFLLTWKGAFIFSGIILAFIVIQSVIDCLRGKSANYLFFTGAIIFLSAALVFLPFVQNTIYRASVLLELFTVIAAALVSLVVMKRGLLPYLYPVMLVTLGGVVLGIGYLVFPGQLEGIKTSLNYVVSLNAIDRTVSENLSILFPSGQFSLYALWVNYTTAFYLGLIGIAILIFNSVKNGKPGATFLLVWSVTMLFLTLMMRRFAVFYAVNVALLAAYVCIRFLEYLGIIRRESPEITGQYITSEKSGRAKKSRSPSRDSVPLVSVLLGWMPVLLLVFLPNIPTSIYVASKLAFVPSNAWCESLDWLKKNSPDPYGDPAFYYQDYTKAASKKDHFPDSAYAVTAWWDYGYWIVRTGHRLPNCHPGGGKRGQVAGLFLDQDTASAYKKATGLSSKYIMLDYHTVTGMYDSILLYAGREREQFFDGYYQPIPGTSRLEPVVMYHPEYYRSLAVRLYNFDGAAVTPQSCRVIAWEERMSVEGKYRHLVSSRDFPRYEEAVAFIAGQKSGNFSIVSDNPFISPVPLDAVTGYRLAFSSDSKYKSTDGIEMPEVKVFEYVK